jgi:tetraacyldisaccharide 4'-kinase
LKIFEHIYHFVSGSKNFLYDHDILQPVILPVPVISVGNLSFGGVGKTPCIILLGQHLSQNNKKLVIVSKSYKASLKNPQRVDLKMKSAASIFGDEACLIQSLLPRAEVWSGPNKTETAAASMRARPALILVDDGFSHRRLKRNFDLVLIDANEGFETYMRESRTNLKRAHAVLITKVNIYTSVQVEKIQEQIHKLAPHLRGNIFVSSVRTSLKLEKNDPLFVFCGLGRPQSFLSDLKKQGFNVVSQEIFPDHFEYTEKDQGRIFAKFLDLKNERRNLKLVTTQKDFVKLRNSDLLKHANVAEHEMVMDTELEEALIEKIRKSF